MDMCGMVSYTIVPAENPINVPIAEPFLMIPMLTPSPGTSLYPFPGSHVCFKSVLVCMVALLWSKFPPTLLLLIHL